MRIKDYLSLSVFILLLSLSVYGKSPYYSQIKLLYLGKLDNVESFLQSNQANDINTPQYLWLMLLKAEYYYQFQVVEQFKNYTDSAALLLSKLSRYDVELNLEISHNYARYYHYHAKPIIALKYINKAIAEFNLYKHACKFERPFRLYLSKATALRNTNRIESLECFKIAYGLIEQGEYYFYDLFDYYKSLGNYYLDHVNRGKRSDYDYSISYFKLSIQYLLKFGGNKYIISHVNGLIGMTHLSFKKDTLGLRSLNLAINQLINIKGNDIFKIAKLLSILTYRVRIIERLKNTNIKSEYKIAENKILFDLMNAWKYWYSLNSVKEIGYNNDIYANSPYNILITNTVYEYFISPSKSKFDSILTIVDYTKSFNIIFNNNPNIIRVDAIQNKLRNNQVFINFYDCYFGKIFIFIITKNKHKIITINNPNHDLIYQYAKLLNGISDIRIFKNLSYKLYSNFWIDIEKNIPKSINSVILIPHKTVALINFETLISDTISNLFRTQNYLFNKFSFNYHYTSESFLRETNSSNNERNYSFYAVGSSLDSLPELPYLNQVANNTKFFTPIDLSNPVKSINFVYQNAKVIHLSGHYIQNMDIMSHEGYIWSSDNLADKHRYTLAKLSKLKTNADMIVYAICDANLGHIFSSHQVLSLPYFSIYNGAKSCVFTIGNLEDYSGAIILKSFYNYIEQGFKKLDALRKTKLEYLNKSKPDNEYHPYYWSTFQFMGEDGVIHFEQSYWMKTFLDELSNSLIYIYSFGVVLAIFLFFRFNV